MSTSSGLNTDVAQPPKRTTSPGEEELQAVCHIRLADELTSKSHKLMLISKWDFEHQIYQKINEYDVVDE